MKIRLETWRPFLPICRIFAFVLIAVYVLYIALPPNILPLQKFVREATAPLRGPIGLVQDWRMFAPDPVAQTQRLRVEALDELGTRHFVLMPADNPRWGWGRDRLEHERKWIENYLSFESNAALRAQAAQWFRKKIEIQETSQDPTKLTWLQISIERRVVPSLSAQFEKFKNDLDYGHSRIIHTWERDKP